MWKMRGVSDQVPGVQLSSESPFVWRVYEPTCTTRAGLVLNSQSSLSSRVAELQTISRVPIPSGT
jgi:hypothetical protein